MDDSKIIELFFKRSEEAITQTDSKYGRYCRYIADRILQNAQDTEEVVNDTYVKVWNTIPPQKPHSLKAFVGMISRQKALDRYDELTADKRGGGEVSVLLDELEECISDDSASQASAGFELRDCLNSFLHSLPTKTRKIFVQRYWYAATITQIAQEHAMKESNVTMTLHRTRQKLKEYLLKEGFTI